ncbi:MAG: hypothetical protein RLZZ387_3997, partial [Chloroflexota bacterium]
MASSRPALRLAVLVAVLAPLLVIAPASAVETLTVPRGAAPTLDGSCDLKGGEYASAVVVSTAVPGGAVKMYLVHDGAALFVCLDSIYVGPVGARAVLMLDPDGSAGSAAGVGDQLLIYDVYGKTSDAKVGSGSGWTTGSAPGWAALGTWAGSGTASAEFQIAISAAGGDCGDAFGLALGEMDAAQPGDRYLSPNGAVWDQPKTWASATLDDPPCQGRVSSSDEQAAALKVLQTRSLRPVAAFFVGAVPRSLEVEVPVSTALTDVVAQALDFLVTYRALYLLDDPLAQLKLARVTTDDLGTTVVFQQREGGVPVFGGELGVQIGKGHVIATFGSYLPKITVETTPEIDALEAVRLASGADGPAATGDPQLMILDAGLLGLQPAATRLVWQVTLAPDTDAGEPASEVFVDALDGTVRWRYSLSRDHTDDRDIDVMTANNSTSESCWILSSDDDDWFNEDGVVGGASPSAEGYRAYDFINRTYNYYYQRFHLHSWDGDEAQVEALVHVDRNWV